MKQICHLGKSIEPIPLENLLYLAEKGTLFNQSLPRHYSISEHGGENSTCDSSLLKDPRVIALEFMQQKLHAAILDAACRGFIDAIIRHTLRVSASEPILVPVKQPKESLPSARTAKSPAIAAKVGRGLKLLHYTSKKSPVSKGYADDHIRNCTRLQITYVMILNRPTLLCRRILNSQGNRICLSLRSALRNNTMMS